MDSFYARFHRSDAEGGLYDGIEARMQQDFPARIRLMRRHLTIRTGARVLDVGCGKGFFVQALNREGFDAEGVDRSPSGVEYAVNQLKVKAYACLIETLPVQARYAAVTLWATIEHLASPLPTIKAIADRLEPGGMLFLDTGLGRAVLERFLAGHSQWYDAPQHLFVFSPEGVTKVCQAAGLDVIQLDVNFERSAAHRVAKWLLHSYLCTVPSAFIRPVAGARRFNDLQRMAKWPLGRSMAVVAKKR